LPPLAPRSTLRRSFTERAIRATRSKLKGRMPGMRDEAGIRRAVTNVGYLHIASAASSSIGRYWCCSKPLPVN
jgi:hypothetical protein